MSQPKNGDTVKIHYTGMYEDGNVFDTSADREPLEFKIGSGSVIKGFEDAVLKMTTGEKTQVKIPADEAYGEYHDELAMDVPASNVPENITPEIGMQLQLQQPDGTAAVVTITNITEEFITMDANHPLAGEDLTFDLELVEIVA